MRAQAWWRADVGIGERHDVDGRTLILNTFGKCVAQARAEQQESGPERVFVAKVAVYENENEYEHCEVRSGKTLAF